MKPAAGLVAAWARPLTALAAGAPPVPLEWSERSPDAGDLRFTFEGEPAPAALARFTYGPRLFFRLLAFLKELRWPAPGLLAERREITWIEFAFFFELLSGTELPYPRADNAGYASRRSYVYPEDERAPSPATLAGKALVFARALKQLQELLEVPLVPRGGRRGRELALGGSVATLGGFRALGLGFPQKLRGLPHRPKFPYVDVGYQAFRRLLRDLSITGRVSSWERPSPIFSLLSPVRESAVRISATRAPAAVRRTPLRQPGDHRPPEGKRERRVFDLWVDAHAAAAAAASDSFRLHAVAFTTFDARGQGTKRSLRCGVCRSSAFADDAVRAGALDAKLRTFAKSACRGSEAVDAGYRAVAEKAARQDRSAALAAKATADRARLEAVWAELKAADPLFVPHDFVVVSGSGKQRVLRCQRPGCDRTARGANLSIMNRTSCVREAGAEPLCGTCQRPRTLAPLSCVGCLDVNSRHTKGVECRQGRCTCAGDLAPAAAPQQVTNKSKGQGAARAPRAPPRVTSKAGPKSKAAGPPRRK